MIFNKVRVDNNLELGISHDAGNDVGTPVALYGQERNCVCLDFFISVIDGESHICIILTGTSNIVSRLCSVYQHIVHGDVLIVHTVNVQQIFTIIFLSVPLGRSFCSCKASLQRFTLFESRVCRYTNSTFKHVQHISHILYHKRRLGQIYTSSSSLSQFTFLNTNVYLSKRALQSDGFSQRTGYQELLSSPESITLLVVSSFTIVHFHLLILKVNSVVSFICSALCPE